MSDAPSGIDIAAIITAGGTALAAVGTAWKGLTDASALKARVEALEALGLAALKTAVETLKSSTEAELKRLRTDLEAVAISRVNLEKRVDAHAIEMRGGKRQPTGQHGTLDPAAAARTLALEEARDEAQEKRLADLEKRAESNTNKLDKLNDSLNAIHVALGVIETHLDYIADEKKRRRGT